MKDDTFILTVSIIGLLTLIIGIVLSSLSVFASGWRGVEHDKGVYLIGQTVEQSGLSTRKSSLLLTDDGTIDLPDATTGWGHIMAGDNEEFARFRWESDGSVTLDENTPNVTDTDTDANLCIFDNGTSVRIRNRLGSNKVIRYSIKY